MDIIDCEAGKRGDGGGSGMGGQVTSSFEFSDIFADLFESVSGHLFYVGSHLFELAQNAVKVAVFQTVEVAERVRLHICGALQLRQQTDF